MKRLVMVCPGIRTAVGVCAIFAMSFATGACGDRPATPLGPVVEPGAASPPPPTLVVSGIVSAAGQPVENAIVEVRGLAFRIVRTDSAGRYLAVINNDAPTSVWVTAFHEQFPFQPCATWFEQTERGNQERSIDVTLTSARGPLSIPAASMPGRRKVTGTVVTMTSGEKRPVPNATVGWDASNDDLKALTETDAAGRFALCGLPVDKSLSIIVNKELLLAWATVQPATADANIEVVLE